MTIGEGVAIGRDQHPGADAADADNGRADRLDNRDDRPRVAIEEIDIRDHSWVVPNPGRVKQVRPIGDVDIPFLRPRCRDCGAAWSPGSRARDPFRRSEWPNLRRLETTKR